MGSPAAADNNALHDLGYKIFLDRYALKDMTRKSLAVGDTVIVVVDSKTGQREVGTVTALDLPTVTIKLLDGDTVTRDLEHVDKPLETQPEQMMSRVAAGIAQVEPTPEAQAEWSEKFRWLLDGWKFVPGGRILAGAGTDQQLTYYNCMPPEQEILTADGYKPLGDVQVGDLVVTHRNRLRRVLHRFERETEEPLYIVKTRKLGFDNLRLTGEHKVLAIRSEWVNKHRSRDGLRLAQEPQWIPAKDLRPGDYLAAAHDGEVTATDTLHVFDYVGREDFEGRPAVGAYALNDGWVGKSRVRPDGTKMIGKPTLAVRDALVIDAELMELFGRWLGDGCVTHRTGTDIPSGIKIVFGLDEQAEAEHIARIVEDKLGVSAAIKLSSTKRWLDLWVNAMPIGEFFANLFGKYSYGKRIPAELMRQPDHLVKALLRGLFQADGYQVSRGYIGIVLSNRTLATQVHQLLLRLGYFFSIFENTHKLGRVPAYRITTGIGEAGDLFTAFFDVPAPKVSGGFRSHLEYDGLKWARIEEIETESYTGTVLDIEVDEDHSFVSAGVVVSNCYVIASPKDSRGGIMETLSQMTEIMSRGGGVGINISTLRPRHAYVKGVNGRSSGAVSWGALYSFVTGLIEQGGCFGPNERIATDKGLIPAAELADRMDAGEVFHAHTHKGLRRITMRFRNGIKPLYEVRTERGYTVRITKEHKVAVLRSGEVTTVPLAELEPGEEILLLLGGGTDTPYVPLKPVVYDRSIMSTTLNENVTFPAELTEDIAYFLGYLHADGYVHVGKKVTWTVPKALKLATADAHPDIRARLDEIVTRVFGLKVNHENGDGAVVNLAIYSRLLVEWLNQNGLLKNKADSVRVPEVIFRSPSSVMGAFIAGYFDADGCNRGRKGGYGIDSISRGVLEDIQQLLSLNGIVSRIHTTPRDHLGWQTIYRLNVVGAQFKARFASFVPAEKIADDGSRRDIYNTYPADVWSSLGARSKYRQRIYDGVSQRISHGQLTAIHGRLAAAGEIALAERLTERMKTIPDAISSILPLGDSEVYDFEVEDVHLLSGSGVYTSNSRRGALMLILNDWHPDVFTFINSKRQAGQITNANISVGVSDKLMDAVKADGTWDLMFPDTSDPAYDIVWNGDLDKWIADGHKAHVYKTVKAREVWDAIIESAWASAEPGVWFRERSNKMANSWYFNPLISTNPCHSGNNLIHTRGGLIPIKELVGKEFEVVSDLRTIGGAGVHYERAIAYPTLQAQLYEIKLKTGQTLELTGNHKVFTTRGKVAVEDLRIGEDCVFIQSAPHLDALLPLDESEVKKGRLVGWNAGDGWISQHPESHQGTRVNIGFIFNKQEEAARDFVLEYVNADSSSPRPINVRMNQGCWEIQTSNANTVALFNSYGLAPKTRKRVTPQIAAAPLSFRIGFLQGLFSADGSVGGYRHSKSGRIILVTVNKGLAQGVQILLADLGIKTSLRTRSEKGMQYVTKDGTVKISGARVAYTVTITTAEGTRRFARMVGFVMSQEKQTKLEALVKQLDDARISHTEYWSEVVQITPTTFEQVYNLTTDISHSLIANGVVVANCGEQPLGAFSVCNLGAINLAKFYDAETHDVAWDDLANSVRYAVRFLDDVIDSTPYFFEENARVQGMERRVGLGTMGIAELMIRLKVRYGSEESEDFIDRLYKFIAVNAYDESVEIAKTKGPFSAFDAEKFLQSGFIQTLPDDLREKIRAHGVRNVTLLTQAPTGTTGTLVNTSTGIEPFFSWVYYRKSRLGLHEEHVPIVQEWLDANPGKTEKDLPDYFATAMDLTPEEHVRVQAAFQRWIDSAISKTCNVPNEYTVEQVSELYMLMYDLGCKGGTIYRDGSRSEQVLMLKGDERAESEMKDKEKALKAEAQKAEPAPAPVAQPVATPHRVYPRPAKLFGVTVKVATPFGTAYVNMNVDENSNPFEVFVTAPGKAGSDLQADAEGLGRLITLSLRSTPPHNRREMLRLIIEQLRDIGGSRTAGFGPNRVMSLPDAVARALEDHFFHVSTPAQLSLPLGDSPAASDGGQSNLFGMQTTAPANLIMPDGDSAPEPDDAPVLEFEMSADGAQPKGFVNGHRVMGADMCPSCHTISLVRAEGCRKCLTCGYSEC
jgi:ribonucleoside-diphosphate reductase alpha chain